MIFASFGFLVFFAVVYAVYGFLLRSHSSRMTFLFLASCFFYMTWNAKLISVVLFLVVLDFYLGIRIAEAREQATRRRLLVFSLASNLGMLCVFKYTNFLLGTFGSASRLLGFDAAIPHLDIILPIGISFHTFQSMSYTIDIFYGRIAPCRDFIEYATFVTFFPQLVAGPIVRAKEFLPQLNPLPRLTKENFAAGCDLFLLGLVKKVFIADRLSCYADDIFGRAGAYDAASTWCGVVAYAFQIYGDFSGYSDMARGLARIFGFEFPVNFRTPYLSRDISEFWQRWHISLSTWLRDNLFIPLGGYRGSRLFGYRNLFLTMFLGGLWHGASWTFVAWGVYHGLLLIGRRVREQLSGGRDRGETGTWAGGVRDRLGIFFLVCLGWVLFRAQTFGDAARMFAKMSGLKTGGLHVVSMSAIALIGLLFIFDLLAYRAEKTRADAGALALGAPALVRGLGYAAAVVALLVFSPHDLRPFIYFQF